LHHKEILEIGCGKGDFLALLCELGDNRGVGIDPACVRERIVGEAAGRIEVIADYYSEKYSEQTGDFVVCRHTLEHIHSTLEFMSTVRRSVDGRPDTTVFFEIPDAGRVLRELAFWDIYYEHCSYFSPGSLARLFRRSGFEVRELAIDYGDQYLLIEAGPSKRPSSQTHHLEESVERLSGEVKIFAEGVRDRIATWRRGLQEHSANGKRVAVWGSGSKCVAFLTTLGVDDEVGSIVDVNPHRHGKFIPGAGREVRPPESLREYKPDMVVVMNPIYEDEIRQMLVDMELHPSLVSL
jgi:SAM-dependent methyltransferase